MMWYGGSGWGAWLLMSLMMVIFWGAVIYGIFWLTRGTVRGSSTPGEPFVTRESPLEFASNEEELSDWEERAGACL